VIAFPSGTIKRAFRGHRTVILPDYQGLGIGVRISDAAGEIIRREGGRYFSKTSNYRMGEYRNKSDKWRPTSKNMKARPDYKSDKKTKESKYKHKHIERVCFSHEYIGATCHENNN
jgi:GNAT superfamily N-acetyltransferase